MKINASSLTPQQISAVKYKCTLGSSRNGKTFLRGESHATSTGESCREEGGSV
jgi:hypothetical protein